MQLTKEQEAVVGRWVAEGLGIGDVQKKLAAELGVSMTYLDTRLLLSDLKLSVKDKPQAVPVQPRAPAIAEGGRGAQAGPGRGGPAAEPAAASPRKVSVEVDRLARPGAVASGSVRFSDGTNGKWEIDAMGRLALRTDKQNYTPSAEDIRGFQEEIGEQLSRRGF